MVAGTFRSKSPAMGIWFAMVQLLPRLKEAVKEALCEIQAGTIPSDIVMSVAVKALAWEEPEEWLACTIFLIFGTPRLPSHIPITRFDATTSSHSSALFTRSEKWHLET